MTAEALHNQPTTLNVGDILYASWGWEQTNIDWYKVVSKTAKRVKIQRLKPTQIAGGDMSGKSIPSNENYPRSEVITAVANGAGQHFNDCGMRQNLYLWDGKPKNFSSYA